MYKLPINAEKSILLRLLESDNPVHFQSKLQGFGLSDTDFDLKKEETNCSRRIFGYWKESLLKRKLIKKLPYRGKKPVYYSITPLGISYLCKELSSLDLYQAKRILEILGLFYSFQNNKDDYMSDLLTEFDFSKAWEKVSVAVDPIQLFEELRRVCTFVKSEPDKYDYVIHCDYPLKKEMNCPMEKYTILNDDAKTKFYDQIKEKQKSNPDIEVVNSDIFCDYDEFSYDIDVQWPVSEAIFYHRISMFILYAFHFNLIKHHLDVFTSKFANELEKKGELKGKKIKKVYEEFNKLGLYEYGVLQVVEQFANHLERVIGANLDDIKQLSSTITMFEEGIPETPLYISTAKNKKKRFRSSPQGVVRSY